MSDLTKKLDERRKNVWESMKALGDDAAAEKRNLSGEEQRQWDALNAELDGLDARIQTLIEGEERAKAAEESFSKVISKPQEIRTPDQKNTAEEIRSFLRGERGREMTLAAPEGLQMRDLSKLSAGAGANTVPQGFYNTLMEHIIDNSGVLAAGATVLNTASGETIPVPKTTSHSTGALTAEAAAIAESDPVFGVVNLGAFKYGVMIQVSVELLADTGVDLEGYLGRECGQAIGNAFGVHAITGTGGGTQPSGLVTGATLGVTGGSGVGGAFTADNLIDLQYSVLAGYRKNGSWLMRDATVGAARKLKDTTNQYIWQPGLQAGSPDMLLGRPVYTDPNVAAVALSAKSVLFGDISRYFVRLAGGVSFTRSDDFAFNQDLVSFKCTLRADGALIDTTGAVKYFAGNAA